MASTSLLLLGEAGVVTNLHSHPGDRLGALANLHRDHGDDAPALALRSQPDFEPLVSLRMREAQHQRKPGPLCLPYDRPHLGFFNDHCDKVIEDFDLSSKHVRARATTALRGPDQRRGEALDGRGNWRRATWSWSVWASSRSGRRGLCGMIPESTTSLNKTSADGPTSWRRSWWWAGGSLPGRSRSDSSTRDMTFTWSRATRCESTSSTATRAGSDPSLWPDLSARRMRTSDVR